MSVPDRAPDGEPPIRWGSDGLVPAVAQDEATGDVLMVGFMNAESLAASHETGLAHYWSRSRGKLWRKGETSGNVQEVVAIAVNCERNSLLLTVRQSGAVCHDGYPTCYYRRLEANGALTTIRDRAFDPGEVYGKPATGEASDAHLAEDTRAQWAAYAVLRDLDLEVVSATSCRLRGPSDPASRRVAEELLELAGVLDGSHAHRDLASDALLEASQVLYWVTLAAIWHGHGWDDVRPDEALRPPELTPSLADAGQQLRSAADRWKGGDGDLVPRCRETLAVVAAACVAVDVSAGAAVAKDLEELRQKPYLADAFADPGAAGQDG